MSTSLRMNVRCAYARPVGCQIGHACRRRKPAEQERGTKPYSVGNESCEPETVTSRLFRCTDSIAANRINSGAVGVPPTRLARRQLLLADSTNAVLTCIARSIGVALRRHQESPLLFSAPLDPFSPELHGLELRQAIDLWTLEDHLLVAANHANDSNQLPAELTQVVETLLDRDCLFRMDEVRISVWQ